MPALIAIVILCFFVHWFINQPVPPDPPPIEPTSGMTASTLPSPSPSGDDRNSAPTVAPELPAEVYVTTPITIPQGGVPLGAILTVIDSGEDSSTGSTIKTYGVKWKGHYFKVSLDWVSTDKDAVIQLMKRDAARRESTAKASTNAERYKNSNVVRPAGTPTMRQRWDMEARARSTQTTASDQQRKVNSSLIRAQQQQIAVLEQQARAAEARYRQYREAGGRPDDSIGSPKGDMLMYRRQVNEAKNELRRLQSP